jgi:hypothetical protein
MAAEKRRRLTVADRSSCRCLNGRLADTPTPAILFFKSPKFFAHIRVKSAGQIILKTRSSEFVVFNRTGFDSSS